MIRAYRFFFVAVTVLAVAGCQLYWVKPGVSDVNAFAADHNTCIKTASVPAQAENMVLVNLETWRRRLLASPWVEDAAIRRVLPGSVDVVITERRPMGIARIRDELYLVDDDGSVIVFVSDTTERNEIYVRDMAGGGQRRISIINGDEPPSDESTDPVISGDATYTTGFVAFQSAGANFVPGDTNGVPDIFVRNLASNAFERISVSVISSACSPVSGCETIRLSMSTPSFLA